MRRPGSSNRAARRAAGRAERRNRRRSRGPVLSALTASLLSLPGLAGSASSSTEGLSLDFASSYYVEDDIDESKVSIGNTTKRYEIQTHQFRLDAPFTPRTDLRLDVGYETMSGASPWFVTPDVSGEPVQVMSGASIEETRVDVLGRANYHLDNGSASVLGGISTENDYFAANGGVEAQIDFNENNTSFGAGLGFSFDTLEPTDADLYPTRPEQAEKQSYSASLSLSHVVSRSSILQLGANLRHSRGYLSDPYKLVSVGGVNLADHRPSRRNQLSLTGRFRHHVAWIDGTLHADYTYYLDDWGIDAHTLELAWHQTLWSRLRIVPSVRYYTQSAADFYDLFFTSLPGDGHASSDYRLAPYGALSWLVKAEVDLPSWFTNQHWRAEISWERYQSAGNLALSKVEVENPGLLSFQVFRVGLRARF